MRLISRGYAYKDVASTLFISIKTVEPTRAHAVGLRASAALSGDDGAMVEVQDVLEERRYVVLVDGQRAGLLDYEVRGDVFVALHTEIDDAHGGEGLGGILVRHVLDEVRDTGLTLRPVCPFVAHFVAQNAQYGDLVDGAGA